ncbi:MAG: glycosyltransferase family 2 protein [Erysipelothrix sp.]
MEILVSIVVPMFNSEVFILNTLNSIRNQTYSNFEVIIVDDLSTDQSATLVKKYCEEDSRFKYHALKEKGGASIARNFAIDIAKGDFIAFLDADDMWIETKLKNQLNFMLSHGYDFTYSNFFVVNDSGEEISRRRSPKKISYYSQLLGNDIGCLTVMYNANKIGKISIPKIDKRNDMALWFQILKKIKNGYLFDEFSAVYVVSSGSLSRRTSKKDMLKYHVKVYEDVLRFGTIKSNILAFFNIVNYFKIKFFYTKKSNGGGEKI